MYEDMDAWMAQWPDDEAKNAAQVQNALLLYVWGDHLSAEDKKVVAVWISGTLSRTIYTKGEIEDLMRSLTPEKEPALAMQS